MSPATQNMALEAALTFMVLLLAMSIVAIFSTPPAPAGIPVGQSEDNPLAGGATSTDTQRRGRYEARHAVGYVGGERRSGPPWGPADRPPGQAT